MSDSEDEWPTTYVVGKPKHLHAVGVIALNYNSFERSLYSLYRVHLDRKRIPQKLTDVYFFGLNEELRLKAIRAVFDEFERSPRVRAVVESNLDFFDWCAHVRNSILHAHHFPRSMFGRVDDALYLMKRKSKRSAELGYLSFSLKQLRAFADSIHAGNLHCVRLYLHLSQRGLPPHRWRSTLRAHPREPLPKILATPKFLEIADHPVDPIP